MTDKEIDIIYEYTDDMMHKGEWIDLEVLFHKLLSNIDELPVDVCLTYITATHRGKHNIKAFRQEFVDACKAKFPDDKLWQGL